MYLNRKGKKPPKRIVAGKRRLCVEGRKGKKKREEGLLRKEERKEKGKEFGMHTSTRSGKANILLHRLTEKRRTSYMGGVQSGKKKKDTPREGGKKVGETCQLERGSIQSSWGKG